MTNPALSIAATQDIGRLYGLPGHEFGKKINTKQAREALESNRLFPSITNIVGVVNPELGGYYQFMGRKALKEGQNPYDALKEADRFRDAAADRGTRVHAFIEDFIDAGYTSRTQSGYVHLPAYQACYENHAVMQDLDYINGFFDFIEDYSPNFIIQETTVYGRTNNDLCYAGTTDFIAEIGGKTVIGDWKTTSKLKGNVALQLSAVQKAKKMADANGDLVDLIDADECWGVQLRKDGTYSVGVVGDVDRAFQMFSSAADLWALKVNLENPLNIVAREVLV